MSSGFPRIPGTEVEVVKAPVRGKVQHALFDFDGTLSNVRDGWQDYMVPMMVEALEACPSHEGREEIETLVIDFVDHLTGKQTIYQMIRLAEEVARRGGTPLDPLEYKREYNRRFAVEVDRRLADLRAGKASPDSFLVAGSRGILESLVARGVRCYLASGTDIELVLEEAKLLDLERYFAGGIYGALTSYKDYSKEKVIRKILDDHQLQGAALLVVGDGYVEIQNGRDVDAVTFGVHTKERNRYHMNANKRERLFRAGAHLLAQDLAEHAAVLEYLRVER
ncbi:MAG: HAD family hydrolase [Planctomycetes bacterium]|nr:HAD family hydrolase [Planctomycetota bacterium]